MKTTVDHITYNFDIVGRATVISVNNTKTAHADVVIPSKLSYNGIDYDITAIEFQTCLGHINSLKFSEGIKHLIGDGKLALSIKKKIQFPSSLRVISPLFLKSIALPEQITFNEGLERIAGNLFQDSRGVKHVQFPASLKIIDGMLILNTEENEISVTFAPGNSFFIIDDGVIMTADRSSIVYWPKRRRGDYVVKDRRYERDFDGYAFDRIIFESDIPEMPTFSECLNLKEIIFHGAVEKPIKSSRSYFGNFTTDLENLEKLVMPKKFTLLGVGNSMLRQIPSTKVKIYFPEGKDYPSSDNIKYMTCGTSVYDNETCVRDVWGKGTILGPNVKQIGKLGYCEIFKFNSPEPPFVREEKSVEWDKFELHVPVGSVYAYRSHPCWNKAKFITDDHGIKVQGDGFADYCASIEDAKFAKEKKNKEMQLYINAIKAKLKADLGEMVKFYWSSIELYLPELFSIKIDLPGNMTNERFTKIMNFFNNMAPIIPILKKYSKKE